MVNSTQKNYISIVFLIFNLLKSIFGQDSQPNIVQGAYLNPQMGQQYGGYNQYPEYPPGGGYQPNNNYQVSQFPVISCPNLFSYQHDPSLGGFYGVILTPKSRYDTEFDLEVNMTINKAVAQSDNIKLNVLSSQDEIFHGESIKWSIKFPYQDVLPKLTQIKFNGMVICSNQPDPLVAGITQTSMWAKAVIRTSGGSSSSPDSVIPGSQIPPGGGGGYPGGQQGVQLPPYQPPYYPPMSQPGGVIVQNSN